MVGERERKKEREREGGRERGREGGREDQYIMSFTGSVTFLLVARAYLGMFLECPPAAKCTLTLHYLGRK